MDVFIVTGGSKGIGFELMKQLQAKGKKVIGVARTVLAEAENFVTADLTQTDRLDGIITSMIEENRETATSFTLINNAGMVDPIGLIGSVDTDAVTKAIALNLTAPMILIEYFHFKIDRF